MQTSQHKLPPDNLVLVRVQDDLHGAYMGPAGLTLPYRRDDKDRNTLHFSMNSIVQDHAYGKFNLDSENNLKGKIVFLADPREMPLPAGLGQVDTWYRLSAAKNAQTQKVDRSLPLGLATIVAPKGTATPEGARVIFYKGGIEARDAAVKLFFDAHRFPLQQSAMRSWQGVSEQGAVLWAQNMAKSLYGDKAVHVHTDTHDSSLDARLESLGTSGLLQSLQKHRLSKDNGLEVPYLALIQSKHAHSTPALLQFLHNLPPDERQRIGPHYEGQLDRLDAELLQAQDLDASWQNTERNTYLDSVCAELQMLPGKGNFFLAQKDRQGFEQLDSMAMAERIAGDKVSMHQSIWRNGMTEDWTPISSTPMARVVDPRWAPVNTVSSDPPPLMVRSEDEDEQREMEQLAPHG